MSVNFNEVLDLLKVGKYLVTLHTKQRMAQRNISHADIKNCGAKTLRGCQRCSKSFAEI